MFTIQTPGFTKQVRLLTCIWVVLGSNLNQDVWLKISVGFVSPSTTVLG